MRWNFAFLNPNSRLSMTLIQKNRGNTLVQLLWYYFTHTQIWFSTAIRDQKLISKVFQAWTLQCWSFMSFQVFSPYAEYRFVLFIYRTDFLWFSWTNFDLPGLPNLVKPQSPPPPPPPPLRMDVKDTPWTPPQDTPWPSCAAGSVRCWRASRGGGRWTARPANNNGQNTVRVTTT